MWQHVMPPNVPQPTDNVGSLPSSATHPTTHPPKAPPPQPQSGGSLYFCQNQGEIRQDHPPTLRPSDPQTHCPIKVPLNEFLVGTPLDPPPLKTHPTCDPTRNPSCCCMLRHPVARCGMLQAVGGEVGYTQFQSICKGTACRSVQSVTLATIALNTKRKIIMANPSMACVDAHHQRTLPLNHGKPPMLADGPCRAPPTPLPLGATVRMTS